MADKTLASQLYRNIGNVYFEQNLFNKATDYYTQSLNIEIKLGNKKGIAESYTCIGGVLMQDKKYEKSNQYFYKSLKISEQISYKRLIYHCYINIGINTELQGNYKKSNAEFLKGLKIAEEIGDKQMLINSYIKLTELYLLISNKEDKSFNLKKALEYGEKSYLLTEKLNLLPLQKESAGLLRKIYTNLNNLPLALKYSEIYISYSDSVFNEDKTKIISEMESKYSNEKNKIELEKLAEKNELQELKVNKQKIVIYFFIAGSLLFLLFTILIYRLFKHKKNANEIIIEKNILMSEQADTINESINYAKRIQQVIFPSDDSLKLILGEYFILFKAKDIISGDFYWATKVNNYLIFAVADCTGHGVPGALMSMLGISYLNENVLNKNVERPSQALNLLRLSIIKALNQKGEEGEQKDGLDIALCAINLDTMEMDYAGAYMPCYILKKETKDFIKLIPDKMPIGIHPSMPNFTNQTVKLDKGDIIYLMSDGYQDQFGGPKNKKFSINQIQNTLLEIHEKPLLEQKEILYSSLKRWKNDHQIKSEQTDDITFLGVKIDF